MKGSWPAAARAATAVPARILFAVALASIHSAGVLPASAAAAVSAAGSLRGGAGWQAPPAAAAQQQQQPQPQQQRAKLDVGFADFEANLSKAVAATIEKGVEGPAWTEKLREKLAKNVTDSLHQALQDALKPLKLSIGKTWVALPADDQKAAYVSQLRSGFASTLDRSMGSIQSHVGIGLRRAGTLHAAAPAGASDAVAAEEDLVGKAEQVLLGGILAEHCYDDHDLKKAKVAAPGKNASAAAPALPPKFCIPSVITSLAKRLNDTQGLVGMTMRFEARALDLAQRSKGRRRP